MKRVLYRLLAYAVAGVSIGAATRFSLFDDVLDGDVPLALVLALAAGGVVVGAVSLVRASAPLGHGIRINPPLAVAAGLAILGPAWREGRRNTARLIDREMDRMSEFTSNKGQS
ncbi:MAG: hypothetical protein HQ513_14910 [Rhodospirillales bacterium]|nr:hypothetical protein [Rhodospirillales bacterium]